MYSVHTNGALQTRRPTSRRPLVSVLMSVRNAAAFIEDALNSLFVQEEGDFELLIVDDASEDDTFHVIQSLRDSRVILFRNDTQLGLTATLNKLLPLARGEFLARMDADDICNPRRFAEQTVFLRQNPEVWVCGGQFSVFTNSGERLQLLPLGHDAITASLLFFCPLPHPFVMFRGDVWRKHGIRYNPKMRYAQDYELWQRIKLNYPEARFANLDSFVGRYRIHTACVSQSHAEEQRQMATRAQLQTFKALGIAPNDKAIAYHRHFYHLAPVDNREQMLSIFAWAAKLHSANAKSGLFCPERFTEHLGRHLDRIAGQNPRYADIGLKLLKAWFNTVVENRTEASV